MAIFPTFRGKKGLKILFVGTEAAPFAKVGGLASVMYSLPKALADLGHDARVMLPRYLSIEDNLFHLEMVQKELLVPTDSDTGPTNLVCNVKMCVPNGSGAGVISYFLENQEYYEQRANVYGYADDATRWALLCRGTLEFLKKSEWVPEVIVCLDWQTGLIPNYLRTIYLKSPTLSKIATVFSIHNLLYQGSFDHNFVSEMDFDDGHSPIPAINSSRLPKLNLMRRGIMYADVINTVSANYAREIMTKEYGELLDELLRERRGVLSGILNGIDSEVWDPTEDKCINFNYGAGELNERLKNKISLQEHFGLPAKKDTFVIGVVSRLAKQKGLDLLQETIEPLIRELPLQLIVVGEGESEIMKFFQDLQKAYPEKVAAHLKFDVVLPHMVFAGADVVLIPSRFEPCGLVQMEAMRMGCVPIVRKTGGLADSVEDYNPDKGKGTGFVFEKFDSTALMIAIVRAFENFRDKDKWRELQRRAMEKDFSWNTSAKKYLDLFVKAIEVHKKIISRPKDN